MKLIGSKRLVGVGLIIFLLTLSLQSKALRENETALLNSADPDAFGDKSWRILKARIADTVLTARLAFPRWRSGSRMDCLVVIAFYILLVSKGGVSALRVKADAEFLEAVGVAITHGRHSKTLVATGLQSLASVVLSAALCGAVEHLRFKLVDLLRAKLSNVLHRRLLSHDRLFHRVFASPGVPEPELVLVDYPQEVAEHLGELPYYFLLPASEGAMATWMMVANHGAIIPPLAAIMLAVAIRNLMPSIERCYSVQHELETELRSATHEPLGNRIDTLGLIFASPSTGLSAWVRVLRHNHLLPTLHHCFNYSAASEGRGALLRDVGSGIWDLSSILSLLFSRGQDSDISTFVRTAFAQRQAMHQLYESISKAIRNLRELSHLSTWCTKFAEFWRLVQQRESFDDIPKTLSISSSLVLCTSDLSVIVPKTGDVLVSNISIQVEHGSSWVVIGRNGCGKSVLLSILSGLSPRMVGQVELRSDVEIFVLPQSVFMLPIGSTLLDQVVFPPRDEEDQHLLQTGGTAEESSHLVDRVQKALKLATAISFVEERLGGWNYLCSHGFVPRNGNDGSLFDWTRSLSGGQMQKIAFARLFYRLLSLKTSSSSKHMLAMLDEATSQLDTASEISVYQNLRKYDLTIFSISHHPRLVSLHEMALNIDSMTRTATVKSIEEVKH